MTEVNPVLVRYRRDRANAFEQPGAPGVLDHLSGAREMIGELLNLNPTPPKPALSEPVELIYDGGKTKQTLVYRADGNVCKVALTPDAEDRLRNEYALLDGPFKGYEMFPQVDAMAYVEDRRIGGKHLCLRERFVEGEDVLAHVERRASEGWPLSSRSCWACSMLWPWYVAPATYIATRIPAIGSLRPMVMWCSSILACVPR